MADPTPPIAPLSATTDAPLPATFEAALAELETLVGALEHQAVPLEQSLVMYQRGVALVQACQGQLDSAAAQVQVLDGQLLRPLDDDERGERA